MDYSLLLAIETLKETKSSQKNLNLKLDPEKIIP